MHALTVFLRTLFLGIADAAASELEEEEDLVVTADQVESLVDATISPSPVKLAKVGGTVGALAASHQKTALLHFSKRSVDDALARALPGDVVLMRCAPSLQAIEEVKAMVADAHEAARDELRERLLDMVVDPDEDAELEAAAQRFYDAASVHAADKLGDEPPTPWGELEEVDREFWRELLSDAAGEAVDLDAVETEDA